MATQELTFKIGANDAALKSVLADVRNQYGRTITEITNQTKQEVAAAASLQRQRSAALVSQWKSDTRAHEREEKERSRASQSLQKQRSSALIAIWKAEEREHVRIAREAQREIERAAAESQRRRGAFVSGAVGGLTALLGVSAVSEIRAAGAAMLDYASTLETTRIAFTTMLGSATLAEQHLKELQAFALKTPFQFEELIAASQRMQALGFSATQVIPILNDVGNAVAAAGGGSERLDRVILAISQIQSKGKVATQELNQLAESGISGFGILEKQLGKSRAELVKMVEAGEISSKVFLDAFQKFSQQNFGGLMEAQSKTFSGAMSNIKDALLQTSAVAFAPLYEKLSILANSFSEASQKSDEFKGKMESLGKVLATIPDAFIEIVHIVRDAYSLVMTALVSQLDVATSAFSGLVRSIHAAVYALLALSRAARGDFIGAFIAMERAQQLSEIAVNDLTHAANAQIAVARELGRIWEDAAARTVKAANDIAFANAVIGVGRTTGAQNVGGGSAGEGVASPTAPEEAKDKKAKGADPARSAQRLAELELARTLSNISEEDRALARSLQNRVTLFEDYALKAEVLESQRHRAVLSGLIEEAKAAEKLRDAKQKEIQLYEIGNKRIEEGNRHQAAKDKLADQRAKVDEQVTEFIKAQTEAIKEANGETNRWAKAIDDLIVSLAKQGATLDPAIEQQLRYNATLQHTRERLREIIAEQEKLVLPEGTLDLGAREVRNPVPIDVTANDPKPEIWDQLKVAIRGALDEMMNFSDFAAVGLRESLEGLKGAVREGVLAWALYGESMGKAFKKALAGVLASIAAEALVQALLHAAYAIGKAAFGDWGGAAKHAIAAAKFTAVAVAAGVGAKLVAGNANSGAGTASGAFNSSTGGGRGGSTSSSPKTTEADRRSYMTEPRRDILEIRLAGGIGDVIETHWIDRYNGGGRLRNVVTEDGG